MRSPFASLQRVLALLVALALLAACAGAPATPPTTVPTAPPAGATTPPAAPGAATALPITGDNTVRLGYVPVMIFSPLFVAQERGYFKDAGINVTLTPVQGGSDSVVQLAAGNFDAAVGGAGAGLLNAAARGLKFTIVAPMHTEKPPVPTALVISAKRTGEIKTIADLKGKKVSINAAGAATEYWLSQALAKGGLTLADVQLTSVAFRDVPAALESGSLDAAMLGEPLVTINKDQGLISVLSNDFIDGFTSTFLYFGEPLLKDRPQVARAFLTAYLRAVRDLQGNYVTPDFAAIVEKYTQVPANVVLKAAFAQYDPTGKVPLADLNTLQSYFLKRGELEYTSPLDLSTFVNTTLAAEVAAELDKSSGSAPPPAAPTVEATIRIGYIPVVIFAPIYVGLERNYFKDAGITLQLTPIQATNDAVVQLAAGNFDVALAGGNAGVFNALARGLKFTVVAPMHSEAPPVASPIVISAKRTGEIKSVADLKGKTIGVNANGAAIEYWVAQALAQAGLSIKDVQLKALAFPAMPAALENGALDAAVITEPLVTINKDNGLLAVLADDFINGFTATYVFMGDEWLSKNPAAAHAFLKAYLRAMRDLQGNYMTPEIAAILEKYTKVPAAVVQRAPYAHYTADGVVPVQDLATLQQFFMERGLLEYTSPIDVKRFVNASLMDQVRKELGN